MRSGTAKENMSREVPTEDKSLTPEELGEVLADATGTTPEGIERGAVDLEISPPEEATVAGYGEHHGEHGFLSPADE